MSNIIVALCMGTTILFIGIFVGYIIGKYKQIDRIREEIKEEYKLKYESKLKCLSCENRNTCKYDGTYSSLGCSNYIKQGSNPPISEAVKYLKPTDSFM